MSDTKASHPDVHAPNQGRLKAVQVYWTKPMQGGGHGGEKKYDLELLVTCLSVLMWKRHNGHIRLYTDKVGFSFFEQSSIVDLWDSIDSETLESIPPTLNPSVFWDMGKIFALHNEECPITYIDLDMIVWSNLSKICTSKAHFFHWEEACEPWYMGPEKLVTPPGYEFDPNLDWALPATNTAILYIADQEFKDAIYLASRKFAVGNPVSESSALAENLFGVQRLFGMVAKRHGLNPAPFVDYFHGIKSPSRWFCTPEPPFNPIDANAFENDFPFTHLWVNKHKFREDPAASHAYAVKLIRRCLRDMPEAESVFRRVPRFESYLKHL